jgi:hypothetical protein
MTWATANISMDRKADGTWWARLETDTHYAVGEGEDICEAVRNAVFEASFILSDLQEKFSAVEL